MKKIAVMIDGGHLRHLAKTAGKAWTPEFVEKVGLACALPTTEAIQRILYYDCDPYAGSPAGPVSGTKQPFNPAPGFLLDLEKKDLFAVRRGVLKFRGWVPRNVPIQGGQLTDADFKPIFEQKGVDMRIGLDMANYSLNRAVDLIALCTNDTDCIPAMKYARRAGLQVALVCVPGCMPAYGLAAHCDFKRDIQWP